MKVFDFTVTPDQVAAARTAMTGEFITMDIVGALHRAGVPWFIDKTMPAYEASNRLLQKERKAGLIEHIGGGKWRTK